jgi:hypothetical protein
MYPMVTVPTMLHGRVAVLPVVAIVAAIGIRVARSKVLAVCIRVELRAIARIFDNGLRQRRSYESCRGKSRDPKQCKFHLGLLDGAKEQMGARVSSAMGFLVGSFKRDNSAPEVSRRQ